MKKLIVMAAVVCAAVAAQAVSFQWSASKVKDYKGENSYSGALTLYYAENGAATYAKYGDSTMTDGAFTWQDDTCSLLTAGKIYAFYYTMTDAKGNVFTSGTKTGRANTSVSTRYVNFTDTGSWAVEPEPTPEPTSAMLMLLGVAGLALKRKRA